MLLYYNSDFSVKMIQITNFSTECAKGTTYQSEHCIVAFVENFAEGVPRLLINGKTIMDSKIPSAPIATAEELMAYEARHKNLQIVPYVGVYPYGLLVYPVSKV